MSVEPEIKHFPSEDPRLDWVSKHDPRSLNYKYGAVRRETVPDRIRMWDTGPVLNQGQEGACVGFGWTAEFLASPRPDKTATADVGNGYARAYYRRCLEVDEFPGEADEGTSVLAGAQVAVEHGRIEEFRWCMTVDDVRAAVIDEGPVVIGIPWHEGMYDTRPSGLVEVHGPVVGGHCIVLTGFHPSIRLAGESWTARFRAYRWRNSWGESYGKDGNGWIKEEDLAGLLAQWGEACVPMRRKMVRLS